MSDNIQEAEVGSGTKVADTKQSEKRAQITLKAIQLRLKQEKERAALQAQKKSLSVKEDIGESFSPSQIAALKAEYSKINTVDPDSDMYKKLIAMLDRLDLKSLKSLAGAEVKFVSKLAQNRVARKSMKEEVQLDELSNEKLADYKKKAGADASAADKVGDTKTGNKRFSGIMKATRKQFDNDAKKTVSEADARIPRKEGQPAKSDKHSDLYTDEDPKGTIHGLKFATAEDAKQSVDKIKSSGRSHAHKIQAAIAMEQRAKVMRKKEAAAVYREYIESMKKETQEELSPKQKALDKNKNGKIDGEDLAKLRGEELSAKQKKIDFNKNNKIDGSDLAKLRKEEIDLQEKSDYEVYHKDYSTAVQTAIKQAEKRGFEVDMDDWHDKVATGPKKPSSGKTNSFSINLMKDGKPSKKKLQMQVYNMDNQKYELNMYIEAVVDEACWDTHKQVGMKKKGDRMVPDCRPKNEASSPAQQAAIAIAMKKAGKEPKMSESIVDKIKAIKRGMQAKAKADDHFDKAGDPKNANASKDLKKAVRYTNLLNKEETEIVAEARKKSFKDVKKKMKEEEMPSKATVKKGDMLTGKREPIEINPELKEPAR